MLQRDKSKKPEPTPCQECGEPQEPYWVEQIGSADDDDGFMFGGFWGAISVCSACESEKQAERERQDRRRKLKRDVSAANMPIRHVKTRIPLKPALLEFLRGFDDDEDRPVQNGCYLTGPTGGGKTSQLVSAGLWWLKNYPRRSVQYARETDIIDYLRDWDQNPSIQRYTKPHLLLVDELGIAKATEFTGERLGKLLDERYASLKPTVFASNWNPQQLADLVTPVTRGGATREFRNYDDRAVDRILEMCAGNIFVLNTNHRRGTA